MEVTTINWSPLWISLQTAIVTIMIVSVLGVFTAWWIIRQKNEAVKIIADGIFTLPLVLPPTVVGFLLLFTLGNNRLIGRFFVEKLGVQIAFTWTATVITASVVAFPLMYRAAKGALSQSVVYPIGILKTAANKSEAAVFVEFLESPKAQKVFLEHGFKAAK